MKRKRRNKKKTLIIIGVVIIAIIGIIAIKNAQNQNNNQNNIQITPSIVYVTKKDFSDQVIASGNIKSRNVVTVSPDIQCKIAKVNVVQGDHVKVGDVLCEYDVSDIDAQIKIVQNQIDIANRSADKEYDTLKKSLDKTRIGIEGRIQDANQTVDEYNSQVSIYEKQLAASKVMLEIINNEIESSRALLATASEEDAATLQIQLNDLLLSLKEAQDTCNELESEYAGAVTALNKAKAAVDSVTREGNEEIAELEAEIASYSVNTSESASLLKELDELNRKRDKVAVVATVDGIVTDMNINVGDIPTGPLMVIQDDKNLSVTVSIDEDDIFSIKEGMSVDITGRNRTISTVGHVSKIVNFVSGAEDERSYRYGYDSESDVTYTAVIDLDTPGEFLLGMNASLKINVMESKEGLAVPYDALLEDSEGYYVFLPEPLSNGRYKAVKKRIKVEYEGKKYAMVEQGSLKEGDMVLSGVRGLKDGSETDAFFGGNYE